MGNISFYQPVPENKPPEAAPAAPAVSLAPAPEASITLGQLRAACNAAALGFDEPTINKLFALALKQ